MTVGAIFASSSTKCCPFTLAFCRGLLPGFAPLHCFSHIILEVPLPLVDEKLHLLCAMILGILHDCSLGGQTLADDEGSQIQFVEAWLLLFAAL